MPAILPALSLDSQRAVSHYFLPHQVNWIVAEDDVHARHRQAIALAEKSVRIGWTYGDAFKNVRKRLRFKNRDYLFATKDYPSALEYLRLCERMTRIFDVAHCIKSRGEETIKVPRLDKQGKPTAFTHELKIGYIRFANGSRAIPVSANPQAMAGYCGHAGPR